MTLTQITEKGIKDGEIVNADINASAAIAKSKLASLDVVNADINASAAIAGSKVSPDFGSQNILTTGTAATGALTVSGNITGSNDLTIDGDTLYVDSTNNRVGIETLSPNNTLDVHGGIVCSPNTDGKDTFELSTHAADEGRLSIKNVDTKTIQLRAGGVSYLNGGNIGIGTTSPNQKLHVSGGGINLDSGWNTQWGGNTDRAFIQGNSGSNGSVLIGTNNDTKLNIQGTGQINHNGPLIFTKNNQVNPYDSSLQANDGAIGIRGDMGSGNYWGWRQRYTVDTSVSNTNAIKRLPSVNDFQYPNKSDGLLIASTSKIGFAASSESPLYANGVQMLFDSNGLALGSGNAYDCTHSSTTSTNTNVVLRTAGNLSFANGKGIDFQLTTGSSSGSTSALLDDYEEGDWTPAYGSSSVPTSTYVNTGGRYTKVGKLVTVTGRIQMSASTTNSNDLTIGGFPFTCENSVFPGGIHFIYNDNWYGGSSSDTAQVTFMLVANTSYGYFYNGDGNNIGASDTYDNAKRIIHFTGSYLAA